MANTSDIQEVLKEKEQKSVVFTNGCFDILHSGHVSYLNEAKSLGDYLIIGLNSDESVKRLKGDSRPVNKQQDRKFLLENLKCVDKVIIFEEDTPLNLIKSLLPNILVKGGDWKPEQIVGSKEVIESGGSVKSLSFKDGYSTTNLINKIEDNAKS